MNVSFVPLADINAAISLFRFVATMDVFELGQPGNVGAGANALR